MEEQKQEFNLEDFIKQILEDAYHDEETRKHLNAVLRKYGYEVKPHPLEEVISKKLSKIEEENKKLKNELETKRKKELEEEYKRILRKYGLSEEDMSQVIEYAKKNGIINFETACRLYAIEEKTPKAQYTYESFVKKEPLIEKYKGREGKQNLIKDALEILNKGGW